MTGYENWGDIANLFTLLAEGAVVSLQIFVLTLIFALPLGLPVALGRMSKSAWISNPIKWYITVVRGTPLLLQLIFVYFAPGYLPEPYKINLDRFVAAVIAFVLNYTAYFAEIFRGGIMSIPKGQYEAAEVLGFTKRQTFFRIVLPQVIKKILPPISNEIITLVKDTALVQILGVSELLRMAKNESNRLFSTVPLFAAGIIYLGLTYNIEKMLHWVEKKLEYYR